MARNYGRPNDLEKTAINYGRSPQEIQDALIMYDRVSQLARETGETAFDLTNNFLNFCAAHREMTPEHKLIYVETKVIHVNEAPLRADPSLPIGPNNPLPLDYIFIGHGGKWGNPYIIGVDGNREECLVKYERFLLSTKSLLNSLPELVGKTLGCFCKPRACHGDILVKYVKKFVRIKTN